MNSRAQTTVMKAIMGLVLALFMLLIVTAVGYGIYSLFFGSNLDKGTYESFEALGTTIEALLQRPVSEQAGYSKLPLYIQENAGIIVFFDSVCSFNQKDEKCPVSACESSDSDYHIPKPAMCVEDKPCICLFKETSYRGDFDGENNFPKSCRSFETDKDVYFTSFYEDSSVFKDTKNLIDGVRKDGLDSEWPVIYGECGEQWNVQDLYVFFDIVSGGQSQSIFVSIIPDYPDAYGQTFSQKNEEKFRSLIKCDESKEEYRAGRCVRK